MKRNTIRFQTILFLAFLGTMIICQAQEVLVRDSFQGKLAEEWSWIREDRSAWRIGSQGLEVRVLPGNMWGSANNATNVLVRPLPQPVKDHTEVAVTLENRPTEQYEQVDLVWYYDESHMVKLGQELVDGKLSVVMGREEKDRTRTMAILPLDSTTVRVRFVITGNLIRGEYRVPGQEEWTTVGECDLPVNGTPKVSLQAYQGSRSVEHWARFSDFRVTRLDAKAE